MVCPACHDTGYEAVAEDEVAPCTHPLHISDEARRLARDPRFAHLKDKPLSWWQGLVDQEERIRNDIAPARPTVL